MAENKPRNENMIAALRRERAGYVARGDDDRVAQVDEQLQRYGYTDDAVTDDTGGPKDRTSPPQRTADGAQATPPPVVEPPSVKETAEGKPAPVKRPRQPRQK
jgi:hypothetical protein